MSPGATFERVYNELKRMLAEGELPPGSPIEPALIGKQIASSITPIRDALHRLTGERLVEAPLHNGFRVPLLTEAQLRDLYNWNGLVLGIAAKKLTTEFRLKALEPYNDDPDIATSTASLFLAIARCAGNTELSVTIGSLNARLASFRRTEVASLASVPEEFSGLRRIAVAGDRGTLANALTRYHRRRIAAVADIVVRSTQPTAR